MKSHLPNILELGDAVAPRFSLAVNQLIDLDQRVWFEAKRASEKTDSSSLGLIEKNQTGIYAGVQHIPVSNSFSFNGRALAAKHIVVFGTKKVSVDLRDLRIISRVRDSL